MSKTKLNGNQTNNTVVEKYLKARQGFTGGKTLSTDLINSEIKWNIPSGGGAASGAILEFIYTESIAGVLVVINQASIINLLEDIVLTASTSIPLVSGVLLIVQDSTGLHQVILGADNEGDIEIGYQVGQVTELTWRNTGLKTFWTSEILNPEIIIPNPETINDLVYNYIDTAAVEIYWTSISGVPPEPLTKADRYLIYISQSIITANTNLSGLKALTNIITPGLPGVPQTIVLTNLPASTKLYVCIISEKARLGKTKTSAKSNIISFTTLPIEVVSTINIPVRIPLSKDDIYDWRILYQFDENHIDYSAESIAEVSAINYNDVGVPITNMARKVSTLTWGRLSNWYNESTNKIIIELNGVFDISYIWFRTTDETKSRFSFSVSEDGVNYNMALDMPAYSRNMSLWNKHDFNPAVSKNVTHIMFELYEPLCEILGLLFFGNRIIKPTLKGKKYKRNVPVRTLNDQMGMNGFLLEGNFNMLRQCTTMMRWYNEWGWTVNNIGGFGGPETTGVGELANAVPSDIKFVYSTSHMWNYDTKLELAKSLGIKSLICVSHNPHFLRPAGYEGAMDSKPVDWGLNNFDLSVTTNPLNYRFYARHAYNLAARYGNNPSADQQYMTLHTGEPMKVGLNLCEYYEYGNEQDKFWSGENGYNNPAELAARWSAASDGHKGLMGPGYGVKQADPTAKFVMGGAATPNPGAVKQMMKIWDVLRGPGDYPIDVLNFHQYNAYREIPDVQVYSNYAQYGVPPEAPTCQYKQLVKAWVKLRDERMPNAEVWVTEIGYDEQKGGVIAPNYPTLAGRQKFKGYWLLRTHLVSNMLGIDATFIYWYANTTARIEEITQTSVTRDMFLTCGVTDGVTAYNDWVNRKPLAGHYYLTTFRNEFIDFKLSHIIKEDGISNTSQVIIESANPNTNACAYNKPDNSKCIVAWLGSYIFDSEITKIYVDVTESSIVMVRFENSEVRKDYAGITTILPVQVDANGKKFVSVELTECPVIIKTKNIGVPFLFNPVNIQIQATSTSTLKLAWTDKNIGLNNTKIFQSTNSDSEFVLIHDAYIDTAEFNISDLLEGSTHFFKIQFQNADSISELTNAIGITLPLTIQPPTNLRVGITSPSQIQILWDYVDDSNIDSFNIFKSSTLLGSYTLIATRPKTDRSFIDSGLIEQTTYYYKVTAKKLYDSSVQTLAVGMTTDQASIQPPSVTSAICSFSGSRVSIMFDIEMANPSGNANALSVIEDIAGNPVLHNFSSLALDAGNSKIIRGIISGNPILPGNNLFLSYDSGQSLIKSAYNININPIINQLVTNRAADPTLVEQTVRVNYSASAVLPGDIPTNLNWNNIVSYAGYTNTGPKIIYKTLVNSLGVDTGFVFAMYEGEGYAGFGIEDNSFHLGPQYATDAIQDLFPDYARKGTQMAWDMNAVKHAIFANLPADKEFNIRFYADRGGASTPFRYRSFKSGNTYSTVNIGTNIFPRPALLGLRPATKTIAPINDRGWNLNTMTEVANFKTATTFRTSPMIGIEWSNGSNVNNRVMVTAYILEQIGLEM